MKIQTFKGPIELESYFEQCREFHGFLAPGLVLGGAMVDWILETLDPSRPFNAIVETRKCLPDSVQLLTKCSIGNGWMKIVDWGKLAVTLYDIETLQGARVHLDTLKLASYPLVKAWAMKEVPKKENPLEPLIDEMIRGWRGLFSLRQFTMGPVPDENAPYGTPRICTGCGEAFRFGSGDRCQGCREPLFLDRL
jgi:formylmethanofuran dehydrogenase subunit E